jgi:hypothetical protein
MKIANQSTWEKLMGYRSPNRTMWLVLCLIACFLFLPNFSARADIGPKPTMEFIFVQEDDPHLAIVEGTLLECEDAACMQAAPLEDLGPQGFSCSSDRCSSMAYGYAPYHRLVIRFSDGKIRESNIFENRFFNAVFLVTIRADDLVIKADIWASSVTSSNGFTFIIILLGIPISLILAICALIWLSIRAGKAVLLFSNARGAFILSWITAGLMLVLGGLYALTLPLTILIESVVTILYAKLRQRSMLTLLTSVILANTITQPFLLITLFMIGAIGQTGIINYLLIFEVIIWLGEALMIYLMQRKEIAFKEALGLSLLLNATSFLIGLMLRV